MSYSKNDVINIATKLGRLVNGGVVGYYAGGKTSEAMRNAIPENIVGVVEKHKKIQLAASLAQSFVPGAGVAASAAAVASLWKMYYDINNVLGIKVSENAGKSLTSAILTNLSSFAAKGVATVVSEGAKFIPFVGWLASAGINAASSTAIIYGAAFLYLKALVTMYEMDGEFNINHLNSIINDDEFISDNISDETPCIADDDDDDDDDYNNDAADDEFSFVITNVEKSGEYAAVEGYVESGSICTELDVIILKYDGLKLPARVANIYDVDFGDGGFCEYVDSESSGCTLYLAGVQAWQISTDDTIICIENEEEEDKDEEDNSDYNPERDRFYSFLNSYVNDEYKDMDVVKRAEMFKREGDACDENWYKACYYYLASFSRLEHFLIEWLDYGFRNDSKNIDKLNTICLIDGYEEIKSCFELVSVDKEFILVYETYDVVRAFWLDNQWNPKLYDFFEEKHRGKELESENCFINPDYLEKLYFASLEGIRDCIKKYGSENSNEKLSLEEEEYLNEYKEMIADGEISDRDRRYLNKIMNTNGISEARAKELEAMVSSPSLTDEEQEYLNEYRDMISDGKISPRDQRYLDKLKKTNGISEARAKELEAMA